MIWCHREPTLKELLADPIFAAVMKADGIDRSEFESMLKQIGRKVNDHRDLGRYQNAE
jgi:hypothetical protein